MNRSVLQTIRNGMDTFSKGQKRIANYILENYDKAAFMTASKLGQTAQVRAVQPGGLQRGEIAAHGVERPRLVSEVEQRLCIAPTDFRRSEIVRHVIKVRDLKRLGRVRPRSLAPDKGLICL